MPNVPKFLLLVDGSNIASDKLYDKMSQPVYRSTLSAATLNMPEPLLSANRILNNDGVVASSCQLLSKMSANKATSSSDNYLSCHFYTLPF